MSAAMRSASLAVSEPLPGCRSDKLRLYDIDEVVQSRILRSRTTKGSHNVSQQRNLQSHTSPRGRHPPGRRGGPPGVERLAALDSARVPRGEVLLALVDDVPWAALSVDGGGAVADPFRPSAEAVDLLRIRAAQLRAAHAGYLRAVRRSLRLSRASA